MKSSTERLLADPKTMVLGTFVRKFMGQYREFTTYWHPTYQQWSVAGRVVPKHEVKSVKLKGFKDIIKKLS